jgi:hypothetical protein
LCLIEGENDVKRKVCADYIAVYLYEYFYMRELYEQNQS